MRRLATVDSTREEDMSPRPVFVGASALSAILFFFGGLAASAQEPGAGPPPEPQERREGDRDARPRPERDRRAMGGPMGMMGGRMLAGAMDQLGLDEEQKKKVQEVADRHAEETSKLFEERMQRFFDEVSKLLTDEQRVRLEDLRARFGEMRRGGTEAREGPGGAGGRPEGRWGNRPGELRGGMRGGDRLVEEATKALFLTPEDEKIIGPMIRKTLQARNAQMQKVREKRREFEEFARAGGASEKELAARLAEFRKVRDEAESALKAQQEELRSLLTIEQEAKLVALGVLE